LWCRVGKNIPWNGDICLEVLNRNYIVHCGVADPAGEEKVEHFRADFQGVPIKGDAAFRPPHDVGDESLTLDRLKGLLGALEAEERRVRKTVPLIANENVMSDLAYAMQGRYLSKCYLLGTASERGEQGLHFVKGGLMLDGLPAVTAVEALAVQAARTLFSSAGAEFRPLSGLHATLTTILALSRPGSHVLSINPAHGGHFATHKLVNALGRRSVYLPWNAGTMTVDVDACVPLVQALPADSLLLLDHSTPLFPQPVAALKDMLPAGVKIVYDASHTLGLVAGGRFQDPLGEGADVLQGNTHKTFPGPQKGIILPASSDLGDVIDDAMSTHVVSSQHTHHCLALYVTLVEMRAFGRDYAANVVGNAQTLGEELARTGFSVVRRNGIATQSHLLLLSDLPQGRGFLLCRRLRDKGIAVNARTSAMGEIIRIGVQELTRLGLKPADIPELARLIARACGDDEPAGQVRADVAGFMSRFAKVKYSFDEQLTI
jgi:glycine/serine hydroxymethyltransferase